MNTEISFKLFEITQEFIKDKKKAKEFVAKIEQTIDAKFDDKTNIIATKTDLANLKAEIIKWMFVFWIGQILAILAIVNFMLK